MGVPAIGKDHAFACAVSIPAAKSTWPAGVDTRRNDRARLTSTTSWIGSTVPVLAAGAGVAAAAYAAYASVTWYRYGHVPRAEADERDELLDRFMPDYEVVERHSIRVAALQPREQANHANHPTGSRLRSPARASYPRPAPPT